MKKITLFVLGLFALSGTEVQAQFSESFDSGIPGTWSVVNQDGGAYTWEAYNLYTHSGAGNVRIHWESAAHNDYLISPAFTVTAGVSDQASFWTGINTTYWTETFQVLLSTTGAAPADFTVVLGSHTATTDAVEGDYQQWSYNLSAYVGQNVRIAIRATDTDRFYLYVDDFVVNALPACFPPSNLTAETLTSTTVELGWTADAGQTSWDIEIVDDGDAPTGTPTNTGVTNPYTATLAPESEYEFYVRANCGSEDGYSTWVGPFSFNTFVAPDCVSNPTPADAATNVPYGPITLTWDVPTGGAPDYYDLYVGNSPDEMEYLTTYDTNTTADDLTINAYSATVYWQIVPGNAGGEPTGCPIWSFTTEPSPGYCLDGDLYPATTFTPATCDGITENLINSNAWPGEYANVNVQNGQSYIFMTSVATDFITISSADGTTALAYGNTPLSWTSNLTGTIRYYIHTDDQCGTIDISRNRIVVCGTPATDAPDYANLQWPPTANIVQGNTFDVYGQVYEPGLTEPEGQGAGILAWVGISSTNTNPSTWATWIPMTFNAASNSAGNNDEYMASIGSTLAPGTYYYATRYRLNAGGYVYGGINPASDPVSGNFWDGTTYISGVLTVTAPAVPDNDLCSGAIPLTAGGVFDDNDVTGTVLAATTTTGLTYSCQTNRANDVWYSVQVPASGSITIETLPAPGSPLTDTVLSVFSGTCGSLTEIGCNDDDGVDAFSIVELDGLTPGDVLYIGVWRWSNSGNPAGSFRVSAYDESLSVGDVDAARFKHYPNPVKDVLHISHTEEIKSAQVFNLIGQELMSKSFNTAEGQIDMSALPNGTYLVRLASNNGTKTIKVVKQ